MNYMPYIVSWNVTQRCNLRCPHCYINANAESRDALTPVEAKFVIDELSYLNRRLMLILSGGEPMLREDIFDIVNYASQAGFIVVMGSNGTLLTRENLLELKKAGLKGLGVSIDSMRPEEHDTFRGTEGAWALSVDALRRAKHLGIETQIDVTVTDKNWSEIDEFVRFGIEIGVKAINFFFLVCTGRAMKTDISTSHYNQVLDRITEIMLKERRTIVRTRCAPHIYMFLHKRGYPLHTGIRGCQAGWSYLRIDPEGRVTPCAYMPLVAGQLRERSLKDIWDDAEVFRFLRSPMHKGKCAICEYSEVCGGCRARAYIERGDLFGDDPLCTYEPEGGKKIETEDRGEFTLWWNREAREKIKRVPLFMRKMVIRLIEQRARQIHKEIITSEFIDEIKKDFMK